MKKAFSISFKIFIYLFLLYSICFWIWIIIDDWILIETNWSDFWLSYISLWALWWLAFGFVFSFYYWGILSVLIIVYHKLIKSKN